MHSTGEDGSQYDPKIGCGSELCAHDRSEDRSQASDVKELDHEDLPCRQWHEIYAVSLGQGRGLPVVRTEDLIHIRTIDNVSKYKDYQCQCKCNHICGY